jgi:hypothetical protein
LIDSGFLIDVTVAGNLLVAIHSHQRDPMASNFHHKILVLDLNLPVAGWRIIDGVQFDFEMGNCLPHFTYIEEETCIIGASYEVVKRLDLASAFETGSLKYKSMIPAITRGDIPDGVLPYVLARGNKLGRPDLNFEVLQSRLR